MPESQFAKPLLQRSAPDISTPLLNSIIEQAIELVPRNAPLQRFQHRNPLAGFESLHWIDALHRADLIFTTNLSGGIPAAESLTSQTVLPPCNYPKLHEFPLLQDAVAQLSSPHRGSLRLKHLSEHTAEADQLVHEFLVPFLSCFCGQSSPHVAATLQSQGLLRSLILIHAGRHGPVPAWRRSLRDELLLVQSNGNDPLQSIEDSLQRLEVPTADRLDFLASTLCILHGWTGLIRTLESPAQGQPLLPPGTLIEFLAVRLILDRLASSFLKKTSPTASPRHDLLNHPQIQSAAEQAHQNPAQQHRVHTRNLFEQTVRQQFLDAMCIQPPPLPPRQSPQLQVICCVDPGQESFRRHLEEIAPDCQTFGTPGFFGIAMQYRESAGESFSDRFPPHIRSRHRIDAVNQATAGESTTQQSGSSGGSRQFARDESPDLQPHVGYCLEEMTEIVETLLRSIGLTEHFAPLVLVMAHTTDTAPWTHTAAQNCTFCSGHDAAPNARVFAAMANDHRVRHQLAANGIRIPPETLFVATVHRTCSDTIQFCEPALRVPASHHARLDAVLLLLEAALQGNAHERCRRFERTFAGDLPQQAAWHVLDRMDGCFPSVSEHVLAGNAICFVGRRERTRGLFLDRRAFLASYDPSTDDDDAATLIHLLRITLPVCVSVNLDYYFSTVAPEVFGAGSRRSLSTAAGIGVTVEPEGDLRFGLPSELVAFHEPVRLLCVIEAEPDRVCRAISMIPRLQQLVQNSWLHLAALSPTSACLYEYSEGNFLPYSSQTASLPGYTTSRLWYQNKSETLPIGVLQTDSQCI